jgi:hypothetical protein
LHAYISDVLLLEKIAHYRFSAVENKALIGYNEIIVYLFIFNILNLNFKINIFLNLKFTVKMYERNE